MMLVLASMSSTRRRLLTEAGVEHRAISAGVDEEVAKAALLADGLSARDLADALAELKARAGWARTSSAALGCDQTLEFEGKVLGKPLVPNVLREQLERLRGKTHRLHSALVLVEGGEPTWREVVTSTLTMRAFSDVFLEQYLEAEGAEVLGSAGGYHLEGLGVQLFERIVGDYFAILGLPLVGVLKALRDRGLAAV